ncbi:hypothetical protein HG531_014117 [Fusarium graminearum]|nr:hypothetical protein HG531_014117 [Fusarium graminearum]
MPIIDSDPANRLDNYDVSDLSDDPFASPPPEASNKKRKEPDSGLGIDEEVDVKKRARAPNVKLDEDRFFSDASRLLSFYQLWLDDLFPKAKFLDALSMVEKAGHKKRVMIARNEYINESKPKDTMTDDEEVDLLGRDSTSRPTDEATTRTQVTERLRTPEPSRDMPDDDDLYDATPRPSRPIVPIRNDVPEEDDIEALIAESQDQTTKRDGQIQIENNESGNAYEDDEAAMQEMEGLWIVISSSRDGKAMLVRYPVNSSWPRDPSVPRLKTSTLSSHLSDTNRNATNVASLSGRARMGLLDRIFRRDLILRFIDLGLEALDRSGEVARCHRFCRNGAIVVEPEADVEVVVEVERGSVTNHIIDIAICANGRWQKVRVAKAESSIAWKGGSQAKVGGIEVSGAGNDLGISADL